MTWQGDTWLLAAADTKACRDLWSVEFIFCRAACPAEAFWIFGAGQLDSDGGPIPLPLEKTMQSQQIHC